MTLDRCLAMAFLSVLGCLPDLAATPASITSPTGVTVRLDAATGRYWLNLRRPAWSFGGELGGAASGVEVKKGSDGIGAYQEIVFSWSPGAAVGGDAPRLTGGIRAYDVRPVVLFTLVCQRAEKQLPACLPRFTSFPGGLHHFSYKDTMFAPPSFALEENGTPWLLFDDRANAVILSPADNFMTASMAGDGVGEIACGLNPGVTDLPPHFVQHALLAFGQGINATWGRWGGALTDRLGNGRPANDADVGLRCLGYWTDNGAAYYYHYNPALGYAGTLERLARYYREIGIPIRYLQLDSWWYYKSLTDPNGRPLRAKNRALPDGEWNRYGGLLKYEAHPAVLPDGLAGLAKRVRLPLITHNRWIDPASPYRRNYRISGYAAVDPRWWSDIMGYLSAGGVVGYEQDWLNVIYQHSPELSRRIGPGEAFTDGMARAAGQRGMTVQYCMPTPRLYLQAARYGNVTTVRASKDRFQRSWWDPFLYTSRLASAVGIWPWTDVFRSPETDNALIAILSAGMFGTGDAIGQEAPSNIGRAVRSDGVLVKPDAPLLPADEVYLAEANGRKAPMVAWTRTDHQAQRTAYVFLYDRTAAPAEASFTPASWGFTGRVMVLDRGSGAAWRQPADKSVVARLTPTDFAYFEIVPVGPTGLAFFGDEGKFVSNGRKRIAGLAAISGGISATVTFAEGEKSVALFGFAPSPPHARARRGQAGAVTYDPGHGRFSLEVSPSPELAAEPPGGDRIRQAVVDILVAPGGRSRIAE